MNKKQKIKIFLLILFILFCTLGIFLVTKIFPSLEYYGFFDKYPLLRIAATILTEPINWVRKYFSLLVLFFCFAVIVRYLFLRNFQKNNSLSIHEKKRTMEIFFEYWKRGWIVWLMMVCISFSYLLLFLPVAVITLFLLKGSEELYYFLSAVVGIIFAPALTYFIFKSFYRRE